MTNMDKLYEAVEARGPVCVGLDTDFSYLPADFVDSTLSRGENIVRFNKKLIDATKAVAGCYKVQIAYYESLGLEGMKAYADTLKAVREAGVPVIADIKRGDIAKTAEMYAMGHFTGDFESDFVTLAPYMGLDSISPYLPYAENCVRRSGRHSRTLLLQSMWKLLPPPSPKTWMRRKLRCVWALPGLTRSTSSSLCTRPSTPRFISSAALRSTIPPLLLNGRSRGNLLYPTTMWQLIPPTEPAAPTPTRFWRIP